jgi:hypothetical protein
MSKEVDEKPAPAAESPAEDSNEPSIARRLDKIRSATIQAAEKRGRLPQPLFWSLFHSEIAQLKKEKELRRLLQEVLNS